MLDLSNEFLKRANISKIDEYFLPDHIYQKILLDGNSLISTESFYNLVQ